jgi:glycosyltransferase involved in cell wall biosynthesis
MKVLIVTPSYSPIIGGSETLAKIFSIKLNEIGIHADVMTFNMNEKWKPIWKEETYKSGAFRVFRIPAFNPFPNLPNPLFYLLRVNVIPKPSFLSKLKNYDVIHFISEADLAFPVFSCFVNKPKIMHCCGIFLYGGFYWYYTFKRPFLRKVLKKFFPRIADDYLVYSSEGKTLLSDFVPANKISVLPYSIDTKIFRPDSTVKLGNLVLFVGRIDRIKGLHILLQALDYLSVPVRLVIIGPRVDKEYVKEIEQMISLINEKGVHKVQLLDAMDQSELVRWYQKAAVVVCPYLYETYSIVALEALACGTPVVSTGTHIVAQRPDGILLSSKNPHDLSKPIEKLVLDKEMRENYGHQGRKLVEQYFSWEYVLETLVTKYEDVLNKRFARATRNNKYSS